MRPPPRREGGAQRLAKSEGVGGEQQLAAVLAEAEQDRPLPRLGPCQRPVQRKECFARAGTPQHNRTRLRCEPSSDQAVKLRQAEGKARAQTLRAGDSLAGNRLFVIRARVIHSGGNPRFQPRVDHRAAVRERQRV